MDRLLLPALKGSVTVSGTRCHIKQQTPAVALPNYLYVVQNVANQKQMNHYTSHLLAAKAMTQKCLRNWNILKII